MKILVVFVLALALARLCLAEPVSSNAVASVGTVASVTNAPTAKSSSAKSADGERSRWQCVAVTKSGTRCKRKAVPGERLCRQHKKIEGRGKSAGMSVP